MEPKENRRDFLLNAGRATAVAAITYSMGKFIVRAAEADCVGHSVCDACLAVKACDLPLGMDYKKQHGDEKPIKIEESTHAG